MTRRRPSHLQWLLALAGWTFFVWFQRIGNVLGDDDLAGFDRTWRLVVAVAFVAVAITLVVGVMVGGRTGGRTTSGSETRGGFGAVLGGAEPSLGVAGWVSTLGLGLAVVGSSWWVVRGGQILIGDWDVAFKAVHTVLAVVVVGLSVMVVGTRGYARPRYG